jgi:hypothetical protein
MIDQMFIPSDHNPSRRLLGIDGVAKLVNKAADSINTISKNTVRNWIAAGLIRQPAIPHAGSQPAVWYEGDVIADLRTLAEAVQIVLARGRDGRGGRPSLMDVRAVKEDLEREAACECGFDAPIGQAEPRSNQSKTNQERRATWPGRGSPHICGRNSSDWKTRNAGRLIKRSRELANPSTKVAQTRASPNSLRACLLVLQKLFGPRKPILAQKLARRRWAKNARKTVGFNQHSQQKE